MTTIGLPTIEYIGISYLNLNDIQNGCYLIKLLEPYNYNISDPVRILCGQ
jgi:hypothetical protein